MSLAQARSSYGEAWTVTAAPFSYTVTVTGAGAGSRKTSTFLSGAEVMSFCTKGDQDIEIRTTPITSGGYFFTPFVAGDFSTIVLNEGGKTAHVKLRGNPQPAVDQTYVTLVSALKDVEGTWTEGSDGTARMVDQATEWPIEINFVKIEKPKPVPGGLYFIKNNDWKFPIDHEDLKMVYEAEAWLGGKDVSDKLTWEITPNDENLFHTKATQTRKQTFIADHLPTNNSSFGEHKITAKLDEEGCKASEKETARVFFDALSTTNPDGKVPNWYYYWKQTKAWITTLANVQLVSSIPHFGDAPACANNPDPRAVGEYFRCTDTIYLKKDLGDGVQSTFGNNCTNLTGIDAFATVLRHENQHRDDFKSWWGLVGPGFAKAYNPLEDCDADFVPNKIEDDHRVHPGCKSGRDASGLCLYSSVQMMTHTKDVQAFIDQYQKSCDERPNCLKKEGVLDTEVNAYYVGWKWSPGTADKEDWACPGKRCP